MEHLLYMLVLTSSFNIVVSLFLANMLCETIHEQGPDN